MKSENNIIDFLFELGLQKKIEHCGIKFAGVKHPDTLAEHSSRAAQIGYVLALEEGGNPERVAAMCTWHDIGEIRIGDTHRIAERYLTTLPAEEKAVQDQTEPLPKNVAGSVRALWKEFHEQKTVDSHIARDADLLETMLQAKEYLDTGYGAAKHWLSNGSTYLKTLTAKKWYKSLCQRRFTDWWDHLNKP